MYKYQYQTEVPEMKGFIITGIITYNQKLYLQIKDKEQVLVISPKFIHENKPNASESLNSLTHSENIESLLNSPIEEAYITNYQSPSNLNHKETLSILTEKEEVTISYEGIPNSPDLIHIYWIPEKLVLSLLSSPIDS